MNIVALWKRHASAAYRVDKVQASFRDACSLSDAYPPVKLAGYCQSSLRDDWGRSISW